MHSRDRHVEPPAEVKGNRRYRRAVARAKQSMGRKNGATIHKLHQPNAGRPRYADADRARVYLLMTAGAVPDTEDADVLEEAGRNLIDGLCIVADWPPHRATAALEGARRLLDLEDEADAGAGEAGHTEDAEAE